jgi:hypothetical protein
VIVKVAAALVLLVAGYWLGLRSPWFDHHPRSVEGTAALVPANVPYAYFHPEDGGRQIAFRADNVVWSSGSETGSESVPPCLKPRGAEVEVTIMVIDVARPFGSGGYPKVTTVICPD